MNYFLPLLFVSLGPSMAIADDIAEIVKTPQSGRYERNTNFGLVIRGVSHDATIPQNVRVGESISITYTKDGKHVTESFSVAEITVKKDLCRLHDTINRQAAKSPGNTIYVRPCSKVR